ncbi:PaaI family thioesterase [Pseudalkalibacillus caeni]|nr:PaaI family thioesterase [Pseudalkalibacillus caeni]
METNQDIQLNKIRQDFETSPFFQLLGFRLIKLTEEEVTLELPVEEKLLNTHGSLHGGVYATIIDNIISLKLRSEIGLPVVTVDLNIQYIAEVKSGKVVAKARTYGNGRKIKMGEGEVFDGEGNLLAKGTGTFKATKRR